MASILFNSVMTILCLRRDDKNAAWVVAMMFLGAILSLLLFVYEKRPYNYAISVEACIFITLLIVCASKFRGSASRVFVSFSLFLLVLGIPQAIERLDYYRNTPLAVGSFSTAEVSGGEPNDFSLSDAIFMLSHKSLLKQQLQTRQLVCTALREKEILVENYDTHPICVMDSLSRDLAWLGRPSFDDQVAAIRAGGESVEIFNTGIGRIAVY